VTFEENKQTIPHTTPEVPSPIHPGSSPLRPWHLIDLFIRPRRFFSGQLALGNTPYFLFVTWCFGMSEAINRIDQEITRAEIGQPRPWWELIGPAVTGSWLPYWTWVLLFGAMAGAFLWYVGGWWYRVRLRWCGAQDPDRRLARLVYIYASFVYAGPVVALSVMWTILYANYAQVYSSDEIYSALVLIFPFWSLIPSYIGARTLFEVSRWKARLWFVVLPGLFYFGAIVFLAVLGALVEG
jgi:hypothetical protein